MNTSSIASLLGLFFMAASGGTSSMPASTPALLQPNNAILSAIVTVSLPSKEEQKTPIKNAVDRQTFYITAYSSSVDETDDTPFITASGTEVRDGIVATNALPMGASVRIPELFGDKVFIVEDRMHYRFRDRVDIWMPSKAEARIFGKKLAEVEILEY